MLGAIFALYRGTESATVETKMSVGRSKDRSLSDDLRSTHDRLSSTSRFPWHAEARLRLGIEIEANYSISTGGLVSKSGWSPFEGQTIEGREWPIGMPKAAT